MNLRALVLLLVSFVTVFAVPFLRAQAQPAANVRTGAQVRPADGKPAYSLPPETLRKAVTFSHSRIALDFLSSGWGILQLILLLGLGIIARMRNFAVAVSRNRWAQGFVFTFLLLLVTTLLTLPLDMVGHHTAVEYGLSVQGWGSWFWDMAKTFALAFVFGGLLVMLLFWVIRRSPSRWWFWFWIPAVAVTVFAVFVAPIFLDPLFNTFESLGKTDPALVARLEQVVQRGGIEIPPDRMFLMKASEKVTTLNAYVTGIGASKRVVVWDNTISHATPDEISYIFGHEMGHYVLNHIYKTLAFLSVLMLVEFYLGYRCVGGLIRRYGRTRWQIDSQHDWGALAVLLLVFSVLSFLGEPIINAYSRAQEHAADVYGQEAIHGIVADPQSTAQQSFQLLGELSLSEPDPNPFVVFWSFSHPSISSRATFALRYNPWSQGEHPRYFQK
ncbi:M48 family metallopeptidase [Edaphobacter bradus]|uniref:M48 family metallopeptidase n=1 Tax=Edaphobacter bradus TaxID=2259016 RepID=UPI0021E0633F|nr:M48 family metallopeptidase [Edaphobacter bradus]